MCRFFVNFDQFCTLFKPLLVVHYFYPFQLQSNPFHSLATLKSIKGYIDVLGQVSVCASVFMIVALSYERHFAICSPHAYRIHLRTVARWKHLAVYVVPVVIASVFVNVPKIINLKREMMKNVIYVKINLYLRYVRYILKYETY